MFYMPIKTKFALAIAIFLWASAFVGIRVCLQGYSPEGLALLRYIIASICMGIIYYRLPQRNSMSFRDQCILLIVGAMGIGIYNLTLNHGEMLISSGMACFITSQSPIITAIIAMIFLGEKFNISRVAGFTLSLLGVALIAVGELGEFKWDISIFT